jgi:hypothetical protein
MNENISKKWQASSHRFQKHFEQKEIKFFVQNLPTVETWGTDNFICKLGKKKTTKKPI